MISKSQYACGTLGQSQDYLSKLQELSRGKVKQNPFGEFHNPLGQFSGT